MTSVPKVVLILGSGANVGQSVTKAFVAKGYKVASVSRCAEEDASSTDVTNITADLSDPGSVAQVFSKVKSSLGTPSVVVYNAAVVFPVDGKDPLSLSLADLKSSLDINTLSAYSAAQEARKGFGELPDSSSRTFIYTGNLLNTAVMPSLLDLGVGKSATAHIVRAAATVYADRGFKFYYADERKPDGSPPYRAIDGDAHARLYTELAEHKEQGEWQQTFVKGVGYKKF